MKTKKQKAREEINKAVKEYLSRGGKITRIKVEDWKGDPLLFVGRYPEGHDCVNNPGNWSGG